MLSLTLYKWYQYCLDIKTQKAAKKREQWESEHPRNNGRHGRRQKRSISVEHHVETLVVVDPDMTEYYKNEDVTNYVLTIMNMVCFKNVLPFHQILDGHLNLKENYKLTLSCYMHHGSSFTYRFPIFSMMPLWEMQSTSWLFESFYWRMNRFVNVFSTIDAIRVFSTQKCNSKVHSKKIGEFFL